MHLAQQNRRISGAGEIHKRARQTLVLAANPPVMQAKCIEHCSGQSRGCSRGIVYKTQIHDLTIPHTEVILKLRKREKIY